MTVIAIVISLDINIGGCQHEWMSTVAVAAVEKQNFPDTTTCKGWKWGTSGLVCCHITAVVAIAVSLDVNIDGYEQWKWWTWGNLGEQSDSWHHDLPAGIMVWSHITVVFELVASLDVNSGNGGCRGLRDKGSLGNTCTN